MSTRIRSLDVGAQNTVNAMTPGYQRRILTNQSFATALDLELDRDPSLVNTNQTVSFAQGRFVQVDNPLSAALDGPGFFSVQTPGGIAFTRNGDFMTGRDGTVQTRAGYPVMGENGPIKANPQEGPVRFGENGTLLQGNNVIGKVRVTEFANRDRLTPISETLYRAEQGAGEGLADDTRIVDHAIEVPQQSSLTAMVSMISANHQYQSAQRLMTTINRAYQRLNQQQAGGR